MEPTTSAVALKRPRVGVICAALRRWDCSSGGVAGTGAYLSE
jgi:hypothetical protein